MMRGSNNFDISYRLDGYKVVKAFIFCLAPLRLLFAYRSPSGKQYANTRESRSAGKLLSFKCYNKAGINLFKL